MLQWLFKALCGIFLVQGSYTPFDSKMSFLSPALTSQERGKVFALKHCEDEAFLKPFESLAPIAIYDHPGSKMMIQIDYVFPKIVVNTFEDLKQWWVSLLAHQLLQQRLERNIKACRGTWVHPKPQLLQVVPGVFLVEEKKAASFLGFLMFQIEQIKDKGFHEGEFVEIKRFFHHQLQWLGSNRVKKAEVYSEQLTSLEEEMRACPSFFETSEDLLGQIAFDDVQNVSYDVLSDDEHLRIQVGLPAGLEHPWTVQSVKKILKKATFAADYARFMQEKEVEEDLIEEPCTNLVSDANVQQVNVNAFYQLPLSDHDKSLIRSIITTVANKSVMALPFKKGGLEKKGKQVDAHVHPLRFLGYIISEHQLKNCLREIRRSSFKWDGFLYGSSSLKGFVGNMKKESQRHNVKQYIPGFCECVHESEKDVMKYVDAHDWEGLVKFLIR